MVTHAVNNPEEDLAYEEWVEDGGRLWIVGLAYAAQGRRAKALFAMNHRDAMALCSDDRSAGRGWMAFHARFEDWGDNGKVASRFKMKDTGKLDDLIEELGLTKHAI